MVPAADLVPLTLSVEDTFKMIISGGLVPPETLTRQPDPDPKIP